MKFRMKSLWEILIISLLVCATTAVYAAQTSSCVSSGRLSSSCGKVSACKTSKKVVMLKNNPDRKGKLRSKYSSETKLLKEIHQRQKQFLSKFNGERSQVPPQERQILAELVAQLPDFLRTSDSYYFDRMVNIEKTVYDIFNKKEEYKSKKKFKKPLDVLEDIQKKQRRYLLNYQAREYKKRTKK